MLDLPEIAALVNDPEKIYERLRRHRLRNSILHAVFHRADVECWMDRRRYETAIVLLAEANEDLAKRLIDAELRRPIVIQNTHATPPSVTATGTTRA